MLLDRFSGVPGADVCWGVLPEGIFMQWSKEVSLQVQACPAGAVTACNAGVGPTGWPPCLDSQVMPLT